MECTTGPLGQGVGNAVGIAVACKMAAARFNTDEHRIFDQHVICLAGDGCLQEGVAAEASAFAGHFGLDNLILIYDSQRGHARRAGEGDAERRHRRAFQGLRLRRPGNQRRGHAGVSRRAQQREGEQQRQTASSSSRTRLIGKGIPEVAGTYKAHGEAGAKFVDAARKGLGLPDEHYFVSKETYAYFAEHKKKLLADYDRWEKIYNEWREKNPEKAEMLDDAIERKVPADLFAKIPEFPKDAKLATRKAGSEALAADRAGDAVADQRQRRSSRLDPELHQGRRRFHPRQSEGPQHPLRHSRTRHVRDHERHFLSRTVSRLGRNLYSSSPIIAAPPFGWPRWRSCRTFTFSRTTPSALAKTARLMNRSRPSAPFG